MQQDDTDTGALTISTGATNLDYSSQSISQSWFNTSWPSSSANGIVTISSIPGEQKCIVANADGSRKAFPYLAYPRTSSYETYDSLKVLVTDPSDGALKLIGLIVYKTTSTGQTVSGVKGTYLIADADEYADAFFGESYVPYVDEAYRTVCYTSPDTSKRVCRFVYDTGDDAGTFNITEYSEEFALDDNEKSRASSYTWQILGAKSSSGPVYILSTVRDRLKIIILEHVDGGFSKKAELDLRKDLSDSVVVKDVVPSAYLEYTGYNDKDIFVPAVLLSHNNGEYYELIIARVNES